MRLFNFAVFVSLLTAGSGSTLPEEGNDFEEDHTPHLDYKDPHWCLSPGLTNGEVRCRSPRGPSYRSTLGTRCDIRCDPGFRLIGRSSIQCLANRRWSGTAFCRKKRCPVLPLVHHGSYVCTHGFMVDSRCDFRCHRGYRFEGENSRTCLKSGLWSGAQPLCSDMDPPKIKCPPSRLKFAEPGKLTATVTWDRPVASDTADKSLEVTLLGPESGSEFKEGPSVVRYKVSDQAKNRAICKFIVRVEVRRCPELTPPLHGFLSCSSDGNNYGAACEYLCDGGYERRGVSHRICQFNNSWEGEAARCVPADFKSDVNSASALLEQFYEKRRILIVSAPNETDLDYQMQSMMIQSSECSLELRRITVIELLGFPPQEIGRIKEDKLTADVIQGLRQVFRISRSYFSMVLLDELGLDRERFIYPVSSDGLFSYVDSFILNDEERDRLEQRRDFC